MYAPYGPYFAFIPELLPSDVALPAMGLINAFGAMGGFAGAYVVGELGGGTRSCGAFMFMAAALFGSAVLMLFVNRPSCSPRWLCHAAASPVDLVLVALRALHGGRLKTY